MQRKHDMQATYFFHHFPNVALSEKYNANIILMLNCTEEREKRKRKQVYKALGRKKNIKRNKTEHSRKRGEQKDIKER